MVSSATDTQLERMVAIMVTAMYLDGHNVKIIKAVVHPILQTPRRARLMLSIIQAPCFNVRPSSVASGEDTTHTEVAILIVIMS